MKWDRLFPESLIFYRAPFPPTLGHVKLEKFMLQIVFRSFYLQRMTPSSFSPVNNPGAAQQLSPPNQRPPWNPKQFCFMSTEIPWQVMGSELGSWPFLQVTSLQRESGSGQEMQVLVPGVSWELSQVTPTQSGTRTRAGGWGWKPWGHKTGTSTQEPKEHLCFHLVRLHLEDLN